MFTETDKKKYRYAGCLFRLEMVFITLRAQYSNIGRCIQKPPRNNWIFINFCWEAHLRTEKWIVKKWKNTKNANSAAFASWLFPTHSRYYHPIDSSSKIYCKFPQPFHEENIFVWNNNFKWEETYLSVCVCKFSETAEASKWALFRI